MTELERLVQAKIPGPETGIEVKHGICDICAPGAHCGLSAYVKDGRIIKIEGTEGFPGSNGKLCTKGAANREYIYREDRLKTPMKRVGKRGEGRFEAISWDEAYGIVADRLNRIKAESGPDAVMFYTGYSKWLRPWLHRLAYSFGTLNYATESSSCFRATQMAWSTMTGDNYGPDTPRCNTFLGWGCNGYMSAYQLARGIEAAKARGAKIIIVDPRLTHTARKAADIHLQLHPGTDGALALGMCRLIIENGWYDKEFVGQHVHGFGEFKELASHYTLERTADITGVPAEMIYEAARVYATNGPAAAYSPSATITHHINGYNNMRAVIALQAICGNLDRPGGMRPLHPTYIYTDCGFHMPEHEFIHSRRPKDGHNCVGGERFPVWNALVDEAQAMDLPRQIEEGKPYPIRALLAFGMNHRMFPEPEKMLRAIDKLDFVMATDLFDTQVVRHADIVLPVCSSLERSELKAYPGGFLTCTEPVIHPLYESRNDCEIICGLANALGFDDGLLCAGYEETMNWFVKDLGVTLEQLRKAPLPVKVASAHPPVFGQRRQEGFPTRTGKVELYSELIAGIAADKGRSDLNPLPEYRSSQDLCPVEGANATLVIGSRLPNAIHSRFHGVSWARSLRQEPAVDMSPADAKDLGVEEGGKVRLTTASGSSVVVSAHITGTGNPGEMYLYHGYAEADGNSLIPASHLDPYSGFPGYRQIACRVERIGE